MQCDIESVKTAASCYLPVAGVLTEVNKSLADAPEDLNAENAEGKAWLLKVKVTKEDGMKDLMTKA